MQLWHQGQALFSEWIFGEQRHPEQHWRMMCKCELFSMFSSDYRPDLHMGRSGWPVPVLVWSQRKWLNLHQFRKTWAERSQPSSWSEWSFWQWSLVFALQCWSCKSKQTFLLVFSSFSQSSLVMVGPLKRNFSADRLQNFSIPCQRLHSLCCSIWTGQDLYQLCKFSTACY